MSIEEGIVVRGTGYGFDYAPGRLQLLNAKKMAAVERLAQEAITGIHEPTYAETVVAQANEQAAREQGEMNG